MKWSSGQRTDRRIRDDRVLHRSFAVADRAKKETHDRNMPGNVDHDHGDRNHQCDYLSSVGRGSRPPARYGQS